MFPYIIAGAIGFAVAKLFEEDEAPKYADGGSILLAPNGKPSNLTPEQYKLVREPAFKQWFGDWENNPSEASKVVDSNGEPLVVYHGTQKKFNVFDKKEIGSNYGYDTFGFYFTEDGGQASSYAYLRSDINTNIVLEVFLSIKNPLTLNEIKSQIPNIEENYYLDEGEYEDISEIKIYDSNRKVIDKLAKNKDGIIIVYDYGFYAVRDSNQIKLADGTNTTFDGNNPDIRFDGGGMTYRQYADSQFNEEEDRYLASDYFENFEIKKESKENYPIIKIKNGLEYRKWGNTGIKVFDNDYIVAVADMKSIQVATQYQKKGIGLELVIILKEWNPNHRFGSMTPQGFNLMGKYYDTKIANNPDIRFDGGGEARLFTDDGNKLVVFNEYRNYNPYKIAVDDVNDANYITLWKTDTNTGKDKKVGSLKLNQTPDGFLSVSEISIDRNSKGLGLGLEMYMVALKYSSNKIKGIKSYLPNRSNKRQIPKIYRKLNSVKKGDYEFIYKENNPDIRFDGGGRINKTNPYIYDNPKLVKMIEDSIEKDGSSFICTYVASAVKMLEGSNVKIYGFSIYNNPDAEYFSDEEGDEGHHFAVLDDRYILDAWIYNNYQDYQANIKFNRSVFDLQNKEDKKIIKYLYGNRNKWVDITKNVEDFKDLFPLTYKDLINGYKNL